MEPMLIHSYRGPVSEIRMNRTAHANALTPAFLEALAGGIDAAAGEAGARVVVLRHEGDYFCSGMELGGLEDYRRETLEETASLYQRLLTLIRRLPLPVVALLDGKAMGGGAGLAAAADLVLATGRAEVSLPEAAAGMIPALVLPPLLNRLSPGALNALALGGYAVRGRELCSLGFADRFGEDPEELLLDQCRRLLASRPESLARIKSTLPALLPLAEEARGKRARRELLSWLDDPERRAGVSRFAWGERPPWLQNLEKPVAGHD